MSSGKENPGVMHILLITTVIISLLILFMWWRIGRPLPPAMGFRLSDVATAVATGMG